MDSQNQTSNVNSYCGIDISNLQFIGEGTQGKAYLLPDGKVIKVFRRKTPCTDQLLILQSGSKSRFFPAVYKYDDYSIIMEFVDGVKLKYYLGDTELSKKLSFELVELIKEFENLKFTRLDIRLPHIFVQPDESIKIIDPRKSFVIIQPYPFQMLKGLNRLGVLEEFFELIRFEYSEIYTKWKNLWMSEESKSPLNS